MYDSEYPRLYHMLDSASSEEDTNSDSDDLRSSYHTYDNRRRMQSVAALLAMICVGLGNKLFQKFQSIPMFHYPLVLTVLSNFIYIPMSFIYIVPMIWWGSAITIEQQRFPKKKFALMGLLDGIAGFMQTLAITNISSGSLIILLPQAAVPVSIAISKCFLKTKYSVWQYFGALIVITGIFITLIPFYQDMSTGTLVWPLVLVLSTIPMCASSIYKEVALKSIDMDSIYLNGWVGLFQFFIYFVAMFPLLWTIGISYNNTLLHIWSGLQCYTGIQSNEYIYAKGNDGHCEDSPVYVNLYIVINMIYNILLILIIKLESANMLWLCMTIMLPLGNIAFYLPFVPDHTNMHYSDIGGLFLTLFGMIIYKTECVSLRKKV